jgi:diguanylate cyclase (GGDEF)-like protein
MENTTDNLGTVVAQGRPIFTGTRKACLIQIYPPGPGLGSRYNLGDTPLIIGRGADCDICVHDDTASRHHARVQFDTASYVVVDLQSTNGTFVNEVPVALQALEDGDYLCVGNSIFRFLSGGNVESDFHEEIYRLTIIDALTDIHNKRYLLEFLDREMARSNRHGRPLTLLLFDIDHFKQINDTRGHLCGDYTLSKLAGLVKTVISEDELFARYGGEEFAVVLPETTLEGGAQVGERIRALVEQHPFEFEEQPYQVTISVGVATTAGNDSMTTFELLSRADEKLYQAKHLGRNQVAH